MNDSIHNLMYSKLPSGKLLIVVEDEFGRISQTVLPENLTNGSVRAIAHVGKKTQDERPSGMAEIERRLAKLEEHVMKLQTLVYEV